MAIKRIVAQSRKEKAWELLANRDEKEIVDIHEAWALATEHKEFIVYPMSRFDEVMQGKTPHEVADLIWKDFDASAPYFRFNEGGDAITEFRAGDLILFCWGADIVAWLVEKFPKLDDTLYSEVMVLKRSLESKPVCVEALQYEITLSRLDWSRVICAINEAEGYSALSKSDIEALPSIRAKLEQQFDMLDAETYPEWRNAIHEYYEMKGGE